MVKFIHCYKLKKEQCVSINRKILSVTFSESLVFLAANDFTISIYNISTFEEVTCINTLGLTKLLKCDNEGKNESIFCSKYGLKDLIYVIFFSQEIYWQQSNLMKNSP